MNLSGYDVGLEGDGAQDASGMTGAALAHLGASHDLGDMGYGTQGMAHVGQLGSFGQDGTVNGLATSAQYDHNPVSGSSNVGISHGSGSGNGPNSIQYQSPSAGPSSHGHVQPQTSGHGQQQGIFDVDELMAFFKQTQMGAFFRQRVDPPDFLRPAFPDPDELRCVS